MDVSREDILKIIDEVDSRRIDIRKTIEKAAEFEGEKGVAIFKINKTVIKKLKVGKKYVYKAYYLKDSITKYIILK